jgi:hypothetical protein
MAEPATSPHAPIPLPVLSELAVRLYNRLPQIYRTLDARNDYDLLRYIAAAVSFAGQIDDRIEEIRGARPVGPASPEPWDLEADELERWRAARQTRLSLLGDPVTAPPEWLPYIAQLVGAKLHPKASLQERRDTITAATSGYRAGTRAALADAVRSVLVGSQYVEIIPHMGQGGTDGTVWEITIRTRGTETPVSSAEVLEAVVRKGAKPAGAKLYHVTFGTSWDKIETTFPTAADWERPWSDIEEAGVTYSDSGENMAPGASFESAVDRAKWTQLAEGGGSVPTWAAGNGAGIDGATSGRLTKVGATGGMRLRTAAAVVDVAKILPNREFLWSISAKPSVAVPVSMVIDWQNSAGTAISSTTIPVGVLTAGEWNRTQLTTKHLSPANAARAVLTVVVTGTVAAGVTLDVDAALFRLLSAATGG